MTKLSNEQRDALPKSTFGLPEERKCPMPDESHARGAKVRTSAQAKGGKLSTADKAKVDRKADRVLDR